MDNINTDEGVQSVKANLGSPLSVAAAAGKQPGKCGEQREGISSSFRY